MEIQQHRLATLSKEELIVLVESLQEVSRMKVKPPKAGYYNETFGRQLVPTMKAVATDRKTRIFRFSSYPQFRKQTLRLRLYYSMKYAKDHLILEFSEEERKHLDKLDVQVTTQGVVVRYRIDFADFTPEVMENDVFDESDLVEEEDAPTDDSFYKIGKWRTKLQNYIETATIPAGASYAQELVIKTKLTDAEQLEARNMLAQVSNVLFKITPTSIKAVKVTPEEYERTNP